MKKFAIAALTVGFFAAMSQAGTIVGSKHDFSNQSWSKNQICLPCHTPHQTSAQKLEPIQGPLWNHAVTTHQTGLIYATASDGTPETTDLDSTSILCMSCHDGTVAPDSFGGATGVASMTGGILSRNGGTDIQGNHPIGSAAAYPTVDPTVAGAVSTSKSFADPQPAWPNRMSLKKMDVAGATKYVVGCSTCHNVHNSYGLDHMARVSQVGPVLVNKSSATGTNRPAAVTVTGSGLCLTCHIK